MTEGEARWGQIVLIVAESYQQAWHHKVGREGDPNDQYIYRIPGHAIEIVGTHPPDIARVDEIGNWSEQRSPELIREIRRIQAEIKGYELMERELRQAQKPRKPKGGG